MTCPFLRKIMSLSLCQGAHGREIAEAIGKVVGSPIPTTVPRESLRESCGLKAKDLRHAFSP